MKNTQVSSLGLAAGGVAVVAAVAIGVTLSVGDASAGGSDGASNFSIQDSMATSEFGYTIDSPGTSSPVVGGDAAVKIAEQAGMPVSTWTSVDATLGHVTWGPSKVDQDAWIVTFGGTCTELYAGPRTFYQKDGTPTGFNGMVPGEFSDVIDAASGLVLFSFAHSEPAWAADPSLCS